MSCEPEPNGAGGVSPETFQEIIRERKEEKRERTELQRLSDLNRIQNMNSSEGVDPVEIFPKEIWQFVLDQLHPEERGSMRQVHQVFLDLMKNTHIGNNLLPQVLKFGVTPFWIDDGLRIREGKVKQPLFHYLELRHISKTMRDEVDRCIEDDLLRLLQNGSKVVSKTLNFQLTAQSQSRRSIAKLDRLLASTEMKPAPRLIYRSITIDVGIQAPMFEDQVNDGFLPLLDEFRRNMTCFLEKVGKQIWHFNFQATATCMNAHIAGKTGLVERYTAFLEWLGMMPNLKWIQITHWCRGSSGKCRDLVQALRSHPPQKLENLERVDLDVGHSNENCDEEVKAVIKMILPTNPNLKSFTIFCGVQCRSLVPFGELRHLENVNIERSISLENLNSLNSQWPLKRLALRIDLENDRINHLFHFLQGFPLLEQLCLVLNNMTIGDEVVDFLKLPQLRHLILGIVPKIVHKNNESMRSFLSLQFLLYCKNLRNLTWTMDTQFVGNLRGINLEGLNASGNRIDFGGGWKDLTSSNIWQVFPHLGYVRTSVEVMAFFSPNCKEYRRELLPPAPSTSFPTPE